VTNGENGPKLTGFVSTCLCYNATRTFVLKDGLILTNKDVGGGNMSGNKQTVRQYIEGFNRIDHAQILSLLTDDVEWVIPGMFHITGKVAFDQEIENDAFVGSPTVTITRLVEEANVVVAEGTIHSQKREGGFLNAVFCDVFELEDEKIKRLTSYLAEVTA
jgi:uncharacterized protein